jgi:hypothetical protein
MILSYLRFPFVCRPAAAATLPFAPAPAHCLPATEHQQTALKWVAADGKGYSLDSFSVKGLMVMT